MSSVTESILLTIKKMLGVAQEYYAFDIDIIVNINSVLLNLNQIGIGPEMPYHLVDEDQTWEDFLGNQQELLNGVETYVYLKTRLLFDPPTNSFVVEAMNQQIAELEWRLTIQQERRSDDEESEEVSDSAADESTPVLLSSRSLIRSESELLRAAWDNVET